MIELEQADALGQAALIRAGAISAREACEAAARRLEAAAELNLLAAGAVEEALAFAGGPLPDTPVAGVPVLVKDLFTPCRGLRRSEGSRLLGDYVPSRDGATARRLRRAGAPILGSTTSSEFGNGSTTESARFGATRNPWSHAHSTGGSSGGSAAAVARGVVPAAQGNDGGGSLRIPASCCGIFGFKPSRAVSRTPALAARLYSGLVAEHVLTRTVRDSAAYLDVLGRGDGGPPYLEATAADPPRLRVALWTALPNGAPAHADCIAATIEMARLCERLGHHVEEAKPAIAASELACFGVLWCWANAELLRSWEQRLGVRAGRADLEEGTWARVEIGRAVTPEQLARARADAGALAIRLRAFLASYDVWLTPTIAEPPPELGALIARPDDGGWLLARDAAFAPLTGLANLTGHPAMSVPSGRSPDGLPVGAHFLGPRRGDRLLLALAAEIERAAGPFATPPPDGEAASP